MIGGRGISKRGGSSIGQGSSHVFLAFGYIPTLRMLNNTCWMNTWEDGVFPGTWGAMEDPTVGFSGEEGVEVVLEASFSPSLSSRIHESF